MKIILYKNFLFSIIYCLYILILPITILSLHFLHLVRPQVARSIPKIFNTFISLEATSLVTDKPGSPSVVLCSKGLAPSPHQPSDTGILWKFGI